MQKHFLPFLILVSMSISLSFGQTSLGGLTGLVKDPAGSPVGGVAIEIFAPDRKDLAWSATTNASGAYSFVGLPIGDYNVVLKKDGFTTINVTNVPIHAGVDALKDFTLTAMQAAASVAIRSSDLGLAPLATMSQTAVAELPLARRGAANLLATMPGATPDLATAGGSSFAIDGARPRSNSFLIEGVESNNLFTRGQGLLMTNADAVSEVTAFSNAPDARFGRAGGAIVNLTLRNGSDQLHGSFSSQFENSAFNALSNTQAQSNFVRSFDKAAPASDQYHTATLGGPARTGYTYWFFGYQWRKTAAETTNQFTTLTANGRDTLRGRFPSTRNGYVDNLITAMQNSLAFKDAFNIPLGLNRGTVEAGTYYRSERQNAGAQQPVFKLDHRLSDSDLISFHGIMDRYSSDNYGPLNLNGFDTGLTQRYTAGGAGWSRVFSPRSTNELRAYFTSQRFDFPITGDNALANATPLISIEGLSPFGIRSTYPQGSRGSSYGVQERFRTVVGRHRVSLGFEYSREKGRIAVPFNNRGSISYTSGGGFSGLANYIDNLGGSGGVAEREFGANTVFTSAPRQSYFIQDEWRILDSLSLTLGARYEYFGQPLNGLATAGYPGIFNLDPTTFEGPYSTSNPLKADRNNIAPNIGVAYSPSFRQGPLGWLFGDRKTVIRAGASVGYDGWYNDLLSGSASSAPSLFSTQVFSVASTSVSRGTQSWYGQLPTESRDVSALDGQTQLSRNLQNPYYIRTHFGIARDLFRSIVLDVSYVGSRGLQLFQLEDLNPLVPASLRQYPAGYTAASFDAARLSGRLDPLQGQRYVIGNAGKSQYHSLQVHLSRRFQNGLMFDGAYTFSKLMDTSSDITPGGSGYITTALSQTPSALLGLNSEYARSSYDRPHRAVFSYVYELPFFKGRRDAISYIAGGWQLGGILTYQSGVPFSLLNGLDADGFGGAAADRPDFNPSGTPGVRAVVSSTSPTGYVNPDANNAPINPATAMYIQRPTCTAASGCRAGNLGRNTLRGSDLFNWDANLVKSFALGERARIQLRGDVLNVSNTPHYGYYSASSLYSPSGAGAGLNLQTAAPGRFLNQGLFDGGGRTIRLMLRLTF
jgi:hypothetical protein